MMQTRPFPFSRFLSLLLAAILTLGLTSACGASRSAEFAPAAPTMVLPAQSEASAGSAIPPASEDAIASERASLEPLDTLLGETSAQSQENRVIIYTGTIALVVNDTREAMTAITNLAVEQGGYVSASNIYQAGDVPRGQITIRVPAEKYLATLEQLRALAVRVDHENSGTQDVSEEYTDLQSRKTNLEVTEKALQQLLEERQRVGSTSDILEVYRELTDVRGQIEQIEGRLRYLANQAALSTIAIDLIPDVLSQPVSIAGWEPQGVAKEALQALVVALQGLANVVIWLVILVVPLLIIFLIPVVFIIWLIRRWWKGYSARRKATAALKSVATKTE
ncbi:MAG: DUF4349 domain-containing protein [Anaerolineae bacterium]